MIVRSRGESTTAVRQRPQEETQRSRGGQMKFCAATEAIWPYVNGGIRTKEDLERAIRQSGIVLLPQEADDNMASAALMHNKGDSQADFVRRVGVGYVSYLIDAWKQKLNIVFEEIRKR